MNIIDLAVEAAKQLEADRDIVRLAEIRNKASKIAGKDIQSGSFDATLNYHTINMRSRFMKPNIRDKGDSTDWKNRPEFYREGRGLYRLLTDEEKEIILKLIRMDNQVIYKDEPTIYEMKQASINNKYDVMESKERDKPAKIIGNRKLSFEQEVIKKFEEIANRYDYTVFKGQLSTNRIQIRGNVYFQFGDLRVETRTCYVVMETESAGGVTNLAKYWYCIENNLIKKPVILLHLFRKASKDDYESHLALWDFLWKEMSNALGDKIKAICYTYHEINDLEPALKKFEDLIK